MSGNLVPLTVIKGAGHEFIPLPQGENATTADFHSIRTKTESPAYFTSGFYKIEAGPQRPAHYTFEETKYVLNGQIDVLVCIFSNYPSSSMQSVVNNTANNGTFYPQDEATGITHHLVPGDFAFFHVGSKVKVCHCHSLMRSRYLTLIDYLLVLDQVLGFRLLRRYSARAKSPPQPGGP